MDSAGPEFERSTALTEWTRAAAVGLAGVAVALTATAIAGAHGDAPPVTTATRPLLTVTSTGQTDAVVPGGAVSGTLVLANAGSTPRRVADVVFGAPTADTCAISGLALAPTVAPTPGSPVEVPAGGTAVLGWTGFMDGTGEHSCQGQVLTSEVTVDGERVGAVSVTAGTLGQPPSPTGGLTTSTRAAVRWSPSTVANPGWVLERAVAGTDDWQPACGTSAARPLRVLSCTDTGLVRSTTYTYRVTLRTGHWHATSHPSGPVTTQERPSA